MKFLPRILCLAAALYLAGDAFLFRGPVSQWLHSLFDPATAPLAARVAGRPITRSQLDRALHERLWREGKLISTLTPAEAKSARDAALEDLIDHELLRREVEVATPEIAVSEEEINAASRRLLGRFENQSALETAMKSQGIPDAKSLRARLAARIQQEKFIARRISPSIAVTDAEAREWFDQHQPSLALPERIEARHIFIATLDQAPEEAKQKLDAALLELTAKKKDFATLARELSGDPASRAEGGHLGWMTRDRLPADFAAPVFALATNIPTPVRTKLGWHLVEVTARKPAEPRTFEQAKPEIIAALEAVKRRQASGDFRNSLRKAATAEIEILP